MKVGKKKSFQKIKGTACLENIKSKTKITYFELNANDILLNFILLNKQIQK